LALPCANIAALDRIMAWLKASIRSYQTVGVETVLSTDKYRPLALEASGQTQTQFTHSFVAGLVPAIHACRATWMPGTRQHKAGHERPSKGRPIRFEIWRLHVTLKTAEMNVERVQLRVAQGGHAVDEKRIRARRERSFRQLPWFLDQADRALIFDNSGSTPHMIAQKVGGTIQIDADAPREIVAAVEALSE
jgi:predicted ABC-type ATPase